TYGTSHPGSMARWWTSGAMVTYPSRATRSVISRMCGLMPKISSNTITAGNGPGPSGTARYPVIGFSDPLTGICTFSVRMLMGNLRGRGANVSQGDADLKPGSVLALRP